MVSTTLLATILAVSGASDVTLLYFTADWCGACQSTKPAVQRLISAGYPVREISVDRDPAAVAQHRVTAVPCFILVNGGGEVERVAEATSYARLVQMFERVQFAPASTAVTNVGGVGNERGQGLGLPRPLASLARNLGQRRTPEERLVQIESAPVAATPTATTAAESTPATPFPPSSPASQHSANAIHQAALQATVRLRVDDLNGHSVGSGTIIDTYQNEALIVTCGHIFRDSSGRGRIAVDLFVEGRPQTVTGTLIRYDLERDLGLVAIPAPASTSFQAARVAPPGFPFERGQEVFSIGCDRGADPSVRVSRISGVDRYVGAPNIEVSGQPVQGRSGGGLFAATGELIGVCNAADQSDNEGIFASLPAIQWELDRIGQRRVYVPGQRDEARQTGGQLVSAPGPAAASPSAATPPTAMSAEPPRPAVAIQPLASSRPMDEDTEVICIVRSRANPQGSEQLLVLDRPSRELLDRIASESRGRAPVTLAQQPAPAVRNPAVLAPGVVPPASAPSQTSPIVRAQSDR